MGYGAQPVSSLDMSNRFSANAINTPHIAGGAEDPGKSVGGAAMAGVGSAAAGAMIGAQFGTTTGGPGWGTAIGAVVGVAAYYLS